MISYSAVKPVRVRLTLFIKVYLLTCVNYWQIRSGSHSGGHVSLPRKPKRRELRFASEDIRRMWLPAIVSGSDW